MVKSGPAKELFVKCGTDWIYSFVPVDTVTFKSLCIMWTDKKELRSVGIMPGQEGFLKYSWKQDNGVFSCTKMTATALKRDV